MKVKINDVVEFLAISWDENWEFDHPTVILSPAIEYSPNGDSCESMIEDMAINLSFGDEVDDENVAEEFAWRGWSIERLKNVAKERMAGKDTWKSKIREVMYQKVRFYGDADEMEFDVLETKTF